MSSSDPSDELDVELTDEWAASAKKSEASADERVQRYAAISQAHRVPHPDDPRPLETVERGLTRLDQLLSESMTSYLVGDDFTVADLSVCALLAPGACPDLIPGGGLPPWPEPLAKTFAELESRHPSIGWVRATYRSHRQAQAPVSSSLSHA